MFDNFSKVLGEANELVAHYHQLAQLINNQNAEIARLRNLLPEEDRFPEVPEVPEVPETTKNPFSSN